MKTKKTSTKIENFKKESINKKAQSMSINTVIIAILAILILVILIFIVATNIQKFTGTADSCSARQGKCEGTTGKTKCDLVREITVYNMTDCGTGKACCVSVLPSSK